MTLEMTPTGALMGLEKLVIAEFTCNGPPEMLTSGAFNSIDALLMEMAEGVIEIVEPPVLRSIFRPLHR